MGWKSQPGPNGMPATGPALSSGDGSDTRSYGGVEIGTLRPVGDRAEIGGFARFEVANQDSFADRIENGQIVDVTDSGLAVGAFIAASF
jgi:hypothetical protein